ncbi:hypothetical protein [Actinoplanes utahensis]|uniref:Uncharacterized protein n=1 Tax=Actinoplanes utahensis TaxID=1869 RepID=A0A0A6UR61_ACTUT|nr:hypothetical protein [Actinoplanes utahensis]KHD76884.1 hypothetical protein MB27_13780 [Actinoplanes utahensis]
MRKAILIIGLVLPAIAGAGVLAGRPWQDPPGETVPGGLDLPWMWQATVDMDPPGPASVLAGGDTLGFRGTDIIDSEGKIAVVGRNGDYRMTLHGGWDDISAGEDVLLSPDGRRLAQPSAYQNALEIIDLTTGATTLVGATSLAGSPASSGGPASPSGSPSPGGPASPSGSPSPDSSASPSGSPSPGSSASPSGSVSSGGPASLAGSIEDLRWAGPVAWAPDGRSMLAETYTFGSDATQLVWVDLSSGAVQPLDDKQPYGSERAASRGAFAPDSRGIAVSHGSSLRLTAPDGGTRWTVDLGPRAYLAGTGAFHPDGTRIAIANLDGCLEDCDAAALAARRWTITYRDAATGAPTTGPELPAVTGMAVRAVGWSQGRDLVVLRHEPEHDAYRDTSRGADRAWDDTGWWETGHVTLLGLGTDGGTRVLLDPPDGVLTLDVAQDLVQAGRFGGPVPTAGPFPARPIIAWALVPLACLAIVFTPLLFWLAAVRRRRRNT